MRPKAKELHGRKTIEGQQVGIPAKNEVAQPVTKREFQTSKTDLVVEIA